MTDPKARIAALMACFDEETASDIEAVILHRHADRVLTLQSMVKELREAGLASQADELLQRINSQAPQAAPALPGPSQPRPYSQQPHTPAVNGVSQGNAPVPLSPRRGRPPKSQTGGGQTS